jgi:hypothetical protein
MTKKLLLQYRSVEKPDVLTSYDSALIAEIFFVKLLELALRLVF